MTTLKGGISLRGSEVSNLTDTLEPLVSFKDLGEKRITLRGVSRADQQSLLTNLLHSETSDVTCTLPSSQPLVMQMGKRIQL